MNRSDLNSRRQSKPRDNYRPAVVVKTREGPGGKKRESARGTGERIKGGPQGLLEWSTKQRQRRQTHRHKRNGRVG